MIRKQTGDFFIELWNVLSDDKKINMLIAIGHYYHEFSENLKEQIAINAVPIHLYDVDKINYIFLKNTNQNNNYLYIENFNVYLSNSLNPVNILRLSEVVTSSFRNNDPNDFINSYKVYYPFYVKNFQNSYFKGKIFSKFINTLSGLLPYSANTAGLTKKYSMVMNPDKSFDIFYTTIPPDVDKLTI